MADLVGDYLFSDPDLIRTLSTEHRNVFQKLYDEIKYLCKVTTAGSKEARELEKVKKTFAELYREAETKNPTADGGVRYSINEIVDANGKNYGVGVHLDSTLLDNLTPEERVGMVKEYVKELGGSVFIAYDGNGNAVDVTIEKPGAKFKNKNGKIVPVNKDLTTKFIGNEVKQEAIALIDELIATAEYDASSTPKYPHGRLDNNGKNDWEYWTTYIQDKSNTIWEATLNITNSTDGKKILYDISPIKKVGRSVKSDTLPTDNSIPRNVPNVNNKNSLSHDVTLAPVRGGIYGKDIALAPVREDIAQAKSEPNLLEQGLTAIANEKKKASTEPKQATLLEQALTAIAQQSEDSGIRDQLRSNQATLNALPSAADIHIPEDYAQMDITGKKNWVIKKLEQTGYKVTRKGFGIIDFAKKRLKSAFNYFEKGSVEEAAFEALPYVLENGIEISTHNQHKGRDYGTITIAAPITINGTRGNMAVVVKQTTGNYYKVHRILTPDGSVFVLPEIANEAESTPAGEVPETGSLATPKDSASVNSIPQSEPVVNQAVSSAESMIDRDDFISRRASQLYEEIRDLCSLPPHL